MEYNVLVKVYYPIQEKVFEMYIPTTKTVAYISRLIQKALVEVSKLDIQYNDHAIICNKITGFIYDYNKLIIDTDIRNGTKLIIY